MWNALYCAFGIVPPPSVTDLFGAWRNCFPSKFQKTVLIGAAALCWAVWISHNDVIIENCTTKLSFAGHLQSNVLDQDLSNFLSKEEEKLILTRDANIWKPLSWRSLTILGGRLGT